MGAPGASSPTSKTGPLDGSATIDELLQRVLAIQREYAETPVHSYEEFVRLIRTCDLKPFTRAGPLEKIYQAEFLPRLKWEYGSTANYLLKRLDWSEDIVHEAQATGRYFTRDIEDRYIRVRCNDWAYSVPKEYTHWLVWTLLPLVDWKNATSFVQERGLAGRYSPQRPDLRIETEGYKTEGVCKEIEAFAKACWPEATDVLWLVNPVKLQSVPALAHAHCFVRTAPLPESAT